MQRKKKPVMMKTIGVRPERVGRDEAERVVDRRADVAVGGREEGVDPQDPFEAFQPASCHVLSAILRTQAGERAGRTVADLFAALRPVALGEGFEGRDRVGDVPSGEQIGRCGDDVGVVVALESLDQRGAGLPGVELGQRLDGGEADALGVVLLEAGDRPCRRRSRRRSRRASRGSSRAGSRRRRSPRRRRRRRRRGARRPPRARLRPACRRTVRARRRPARSARGRRSRPPAGRVRAARRGRS